MRSLFTLILVSLVAACGNGPKDGQISTYYLNSAIPTDSVEYIEVNSRLKKLSEQKNTHVFIRIIDDRDKSHLQIMRQTSWSLGFVRKFVGKWPSGHNITFGIYPQKRLIGATGTLTSYPVLRDSNSEIGTVFKNIEREYAAGDINAVDAIIKMMEDEYEGPRPYFDWPSLQDLFTEFSGAIGKDEYQVLAEGIAGANVWLFDDILFDTMTRIFVVSFSGGSGFLLIGLFMFTFAFTMIGLIGSEVLKAFLQNLPRLIGTLLFLSSLTVVTLAILAVFFDGLLVHKFGMYSRVSEPTFEAVTRFELLDDIWFNNLHWLISIVLAAFAGVGVNILRLREFLIVANASSTVQQHVYDALRKNNPQQIEVFAAQVGASSEDAFSGTKPFSTYLGHFMGIVVRGVLFWMALALFLPSIVILFILINRIILLILGINSHQALVKNMRNQIRVWERQASRIQAVSETRLQANIGKASSTQEFQRKEMDLNETIQPAFLPLTKSAVTIGAIMKVIFHPSLWWTVLKTV